MRRTRRYIFNTLRVLSLLMMLGCSGCIAGIKAGEHFSLTKEQPYNRKHDIRLIRVKSDSTKALLKLGDKSNWVKDGQRRIPLRFGRGNIQQISKQKETVDMQAIWGEYRLFGIFLIRRY